MINFVEEQKFALAKLGSELQNFVSNVNNGLDGHTKLSQSDEEEGREQEPDVIKRSSKTAKKISYIKIL